MACTASTALVGAIIRLPARHSQALSNLSFDLSLQSIPSRSRSPGPLHPTYGQVGCRTG